MASSPSFLFILLAFTTIFFYPTDAQSSSAPAPSSSAINVTGILDKGGQYTTLIRLLGATQIGSQIENQLNNSNQGMTLFAPTDNAFNNLKAGALNGLTPEQQVALLLYHVLPKFYRLQDFLTVSNPVRTQATGNGGGQYGLNFTSSNNQVNVSTGIVNTPVNNALRADFPLAVYEVDMVLLPEDLFGEKAPASGPAPSTKAPAGKSPPAAPAVPVTNGPSATSLPNEGSRVRTGILGWVCVFLLMAAQ